MAKIEVKQSGTKVTMKVTPKYPLESVRLLDNAHSEKGTNNKPHFHINISKLWNRIMKGGNNG